MSQENVENVRRAYTAFNDGDLETALGFFDPDIESNASDVFFDERVPTGDDSPGRKNFSTT